jgi:hypothetical protein
MVQGADIQRVLGPRNSSKSRHTLSTATRKNRPWEKCRQPTRTKTKSLGVCVVVNHALELALVLVPCSPPYAYDRGGQYSNDGRRAQRGAGIYVPCPLLGAPERILDNGVEAGFPQQKRCAPRNVSVELVVQRSGAKHAHCHGSQNYRHDEIGRDSLGHDVLVPGFGLRHDDFEELAERAFGRLDPARYGEPAE